MHAIASFGSIKFGKVFYHPTNYQLFQGVTSYNSLQ